MRRSPSGRGDRRGIVLVVVLFFTLMLSSTVATFARKATIDAMIVRNREARARAEALARGGVQLGTALLIEDLYRQTVGEGLALDHRDELWARASGVPFEFDDGSTLTLQIEDAAAKLNLNAALVFEETGSPSDTSLELVKQLLERAIEEMPATPEERALYDVDALRANLFDWVDEDDVGQRGGLEDDVYQRKDPPYRPANQRLLSVDELRRVDGFDGPLVDALRPYVTVYPYAARGGINPNTAPPHVLSLLFSSDGSEMRFADENAIREILRVRQEGGLVCGEAQSGEACTPIREIVTNAVFPEASFTSDVFIIRAEGRVGDIRRTVEAVLDRREGAAPLLLSWRVL